MECAIREDEYPFASPRDLRLYQAMTDISAKLWFRSHEYRDMKLLAMLSLSDLARRSGKLVTEWGLAGSEDIVALVQLVKMVTSSSARGRRSTGATSPSFSYSLQRPSCGHVIVSITKDGGCE